MATHIARDVQSATIPPEARRQCVEKDNERRDDQQRDERPVVERLLKGQPVDEEAEIRAEIRIRLVEGHVPVSGRERRPIIRWKAQHSAE